MSSFWDRPGGQNQHFAAVFASLGALSLGASVGWSAPAQYHIIEKKGYGFDVDLADYGWICSILWLGCFFVVLPIGLLADCMGRKTAMLLIVPPYLTAWALIIFAINPTMLILARFLLGFSGGSYLITVPLYCTEIAQREVRDTLGSFFTTFYVVGILYAYIAGAFKRLDYLNYACAVLPFFFLISFIWMPESPVYYLLRNQPQKAEKSLKWLREQDVTDELVNLQLEVQRFRIEQNSWWLTVRQRSTTRSLVIGIGLMFFKNFSGGTAIITYCTDIHRKSDMSYGFEPDMSTVIVGIFLVGSSMASTLSVNCCMRRRVLIFTIFLDVLSNALLAIYFLLKERQESYFRSLNWLPIFSICSFVFFYGIGIGTLSYVILMELFTVGFRTVGTGIVCVFFSLFAYLNTIFFPITVQFLGEENFFWMSTAFTFTGWIFIYFLVPETKNLESNEIQEMLQSSNWIVSTSSN